MNKWKYAVSSADEAPPTAPILLQGSIVENLTTAGKLGYDAIEVHTREDVQLDYDVIQNAMERTGVKVSMVITGRLNTEGHCSLVADEPYIVTATLDGMYSYVDMAQRLNAGLVIGWVKGNVPPGKSREKYLNRLANNLRPISIYARDRNVPLNLEVINRYETNIFNTAQEVMTFLEKYELKNCYAHLDTFHMGIDENDPNVAIQLCKKKLGYFHVADNSRGYPGSGQFNFKRILHALEDIHYDGYISVECLPKPDGLSAARLALEHLKKLER